MINIYDVENEILNEISNNFGSKLVDLINKLPKEQKRIAMFAAISSKKDTSHKEMLNTLKNSENSVIIKQIDKIIERFRKYVPIGQVEKKSFGEVFTPFTLVNEMLDTLPVEVWSNPNLKWADLCNGMGNFMIIVVKRLMIGLESWETNEVKRYKHIIENMIYVAELQPKNMFLWMLSIDPKSKLNLNIYTGNSLESGLDEHMKNVWKVDKFDILVSNPPYQELKEGNKKSQAIWHLFVEKYFNLLKENGYIVMVHPNGWRNFDGMFKNTQNIIKSKQIKYLELHNADDGLKIFGLITPYDFYCVKNTDNNNYISDIKCVDGTYEKINLSELEFIPNSNFNLIKNLIAKNNEDKVEILYNCEYHHQYAHMSKNKDMEFKYPCVYSILKNSVPTFYYSNKKNGHFNIPKVIFGNGANPTYLVDNTGQFGMCEFAFGIINFDLNIIEDAVKSGKLDILTKSTKLVATQGQPILNRKIIATFRKDFWKEFI